MRGWGCATTGATLPVVFTGAVVVVLLLVVGLTALALNRDADSVVRARVQWMFILAFVPWLVWLVWCCCTIIAAKSPGFRKYVR